MKNHIAIVSATEKEITPFLEYLKLEATSHTFQTFQLHGLQIDIIFSGIGILQTMYSLMDYLSHRHPDVWLQAGIGGAFDLNLEMGKVYQIESEMVCGFGVEAPDGQIIDPFTLGWNDPDAFPYTGGILPCPHRLYVETERATGMTTFYAHGQQDHIDTLRTRPHGQIENMEGAAFFYVSLIRSIPFLSLRSISNMVEVRDISRWQIEPAVRNLNQFLVQLLELSEFKAGQLIRSV